MGGSFGRAPADAGLGCRNIEETKPVLGQILQLGQLQKHQKHTAAVDWRVNAVEKTSQWSVGPFLGFDVLSTQGNIYVELDEHRWRQNRACVNSDSLSNLKTSITNCAR